MQSRNPVRTVITFQADTSLSAHEVCIVLLLMSETRRACATGFLKVVQTDFEVLLFKAYHVCSTAPYDRPIG